MFESRVILDGSQTNLISVSFLRLFESRVILDGSQTLIGKRSLVDTFESRVILDGSQTADYMGIPTGIVWESCYFRW